MSIDQRGRTADHYLRFQSTGSDPYGNKLFNISNISSSREEVGPTREEKKDSGDNNKVSNEDVKVDQPSKDKDKPGESGKLLTEDADSQVNKESSPGLNDVDHDSIDGNGEDDQQVEVIDEPSKEDTVGDGKGSTDDSKQDEQGGEVGQHKDGDQDDSADGNKDVTKNEKNKDDEPVGKVSEADNQANEDVSDANHT